mgnify:CR=1 FL=1|jgi:perosamine synthetase
MGFKRVSSASPFFDDQSVSKILNEIGSTLKSGVLIDGPHMQQFERDFSDYVGVEHAVAVSSGTAALEILLRLYNVEGREVVVPTNTFVATPTSVVLSGGKLVFADMKEDTLCVDFEDFKRKVTSRTAGLILVHVGGMICPEINQIRGFCKDNNLFLIEDAAHAHGAMIDGQMAGSLCDGGAFSFYPTKVMTTGQGGMITTNDSSVAAAARSMRNHGLDSERIMVMIGDNWCMSEVTAVLGRHQLASLDLFIQKRNEIAQAYDALLSGNDFAAPIRKPDNVRHSYYKYPVRLHGVDKAKLMSALKSEFGVDTGSLYYPPCHLHPWFKANFGTREGDFPVSEAVLKEVLCLPIHPGLTVDVARYVVDSLNACISKLLG